MTGELLIGDLWPPSGLTRGGRERETWKEAGGEGY